MLKYLKQYRFYIILFIFILIPLISLDTTTRAPRDYHLHDRLILGITAPIQKGISWSLDAFVGLFQNYIFLWNARQENLELMEENRKLLGTLAQLTEAHEENLRLRKILNFKEEFKLEGIVARVIAKDVSVDFRAIRINRGEDHGIKKDMAVVNSDGVVGRVLRTTASTADVVTILDVLSAVDAIIQRSRARGIVEGFTDDLCQLKFALRTDDIQVGDLLVSSGQGGVFPKGIAVGAVFSVKKKPFGITQEVEVKPAVDFSKLEEVFIISQNETSPIHTTFHPSLHSPLIPKKAPEGAP